MLSEQSQHGWRWRCQVGKNDLETRVIFHPARKLQPCLVVVLLQRQGRRRLWKQPTGRLDSLQVRPPSITDGMACNGIFLYL